MSTTKQVSMICAVSVHTPNANARIVALAGDNLCVAFVNTRYWRGSDAPTETLQDLAGALAWCTQANLINSAAAAKLERWASRNRDQGTRLFDEIVSNREIIYRLFVSIVSGSVKPADIAWLSDQLEQSPLRTKVTDLKLGWGWQLPTAEPSFQNLFAPVLWSAGDLLVGSRLSTIRLCANTKCRWLFLDDSKNGTRRWCSMSSCGNRAKAQRHYVKKQAMPRIGS